MVIAGDAAGRQGIQACSIQFVLDMSLEAAKPCMHGPKSSEDVRGTGPTSAGCGLSSRDIGAALSGMGLSSRSP